MDPSTADLQSFHHLDIILKKNKWPLNYVYEGWIESYLWFIKNNPFYVKQMGRELV